ncbi:MAG: hypothetical protein LBL31_06840, partial [Spirochaetaceae bacterium]|nr:hypothetical protein [Spirochaetaceae bacterium]
RVAVLRMEFATQTPGLGNPPEFCAAKLQAQTAQRFCPRPSQHRVAVLRMEFATQTPGLGNPPEFCALLELPFMRRLILCARSAKTGA